MARMRDDRDRAAMLSQMLDKTYGNEEASVPAVSPRYSKDADAPLRRSIDPQTDEDYERMYPPEMGEDDELGPRPHEKRRMNSSMTTAQSTAPREPFEDDQEDVPPESREAMVPVPKRIVDTVMASMMKSASRNSIGRSMGSDGSDMSTAPRKPFEEPEELEREEMEEERRRPRRA